MINETDQIRKELGISPRPRFVEGPPPREVNLNLIRELHRGQLSAEEEVEIEDLITYFREWNEADKQVLLEFAARFISPLETTIEQPKSQPLLPKKNIAPGKKKFRTSLLRTWVTIGTAATIFLAVGLVFWTIHGDRNGRMVAQLNDPFGRVTKMRSGEVTGLEAFPDRWRDPISKMLRTETVNVPEEQIESLHVTRGAGPSIFVRPVSTVVRSDRPTFEWKSSGDDASYQVVIYEWGEAEPVMISDKLKGTQWEPDQPLKRGSEYSWNVDVLVDGKMGKPTVSRGAV